MAPQPPRRTSRLTRRRFLAGLGALGTAAFVVGCEDDAPGEPTATASPSGTPGNGGNGGNGGPTPTTGATPTASPGSGPQVGGVVRYTGTVASDGVYDPHRTQAAPFYGLQAAVYSRLLAYDDMAEGTLVPDLASGLPEQPDDTRYIFRIDPAARWQDIEPLEGRNVTAEDVRYSIERQRDGDASFTRKAHWLPIETIETPDDRTLIVEVASPLAPMLHYFADVNAFIVAPELGDDAAFARNRQIGSGPFTWVEWNDGEFASLARNRQWPGDGRPYLEGITVRQPRSSEEAEALIRIRDLDVAFLGRGRADSLLASLPELVEATVGESRFWSMRFQQVGMPWADPRFRSALSIAIDRRDMLRAFFGGSGEMNPWVSWPVSRWSLPPQEVQTRAGYRPGSEGRTADIEEARQLLAAYESDGNTIPEELELVVLDTAEAGLGLGTLIATQLRETLDLNVAVRPLGLSALVTGLLRGEFPWVAGPDDGWVDLDDWVYPYFHSEGTKNTFALRDPDIDALAEQQRQELEEPARQEIGYEIQRRLLDLNLGVNFVSERIIALAWPYVRSFPLDIGDGYQHRFANTWIDTSDARYPGARTDS